MKLWAEDVEPGDVVKTVEGEFTVKSFFMINGIVTLFGTDGSETNYEYNDILTVRREEA